MNKLDIKEIDKKWQNFWLKKKLHLKILTSKKNFIALKCFLIHQEKYIWDM